MLITVYVKSSGQTRDSGRNSNHMAPEMVSLEQVTLVVWSSRGV